MHAYTTAHQDLFASLIAACEFDTPKGSMENSHRLSLKELVAETAILIVAGADTSATSVTATLFYLLHNPLKLSHVRAEIDRVFSKECRRGPDFASNIPDLSGCKLLRGCFEEAMRLSPPVGGILPREVLPGGLTVANKWHVPAGIDVGVPTYAIHHDERYWRDAHEFVPERWSETDSQKKRHVYMPFGVGRANRDGKHLANKEALVVLAFIIRRYDLRLSTDKGTKSRPLKAEEPVQWGRGKVGEFQTLDVFTSSHKGPFV